MKVPFNCLIGLETTIRQPELITVGKNSIIGLGSKMSCHFTANGKDHTQKAITIGSHSVIGGYSGIAPGVSVGNHSVIGACTNVFPDVSIGDNVKIGAFCFIDKGVHIPDDVKILSHSRITSDTTIQSGQVWSGNPARKIGEISEF